MTERTFPATASEYARQLNAKKRAWLAEDPENRAAFLLIEDADHWASVGVRTGLDLARSLAISAFSDIFKDVNGFRPQGMYDLASMTLEEIEAETVALFERYPAD